MYFHALRIVSLSVAIALPLSTTAAAAPISDPVGDFLETFIGPHNGDLDVVAILPTFDGRTFTFTTTLAAAVGTTPDAVFAWGVNRGSNTAAFGTFRPGVLFDAIIAAVPGGQSSVIIPGSGSTPLPVTALSVSGDTFAVSVPAAMLPSAGFAPEDYMVNLWPRLGFGNNNQISDFAPDNSDAAVQFVFEPTSALLLLTGLGFAVATRRRGTAPG